MAAIMAPPATPSWVKYPDLGARLGNVLRTVKAEGSIWMSVAEADPSLFATGEI
ncbi:MAG: hypothetical protein QOF51_1854, partial [Chloroflexota bacterium]|nr:hypothetical protein [Chloroflexota bacterium]